MLLAGLAVSVSAAETPAPPKANGKALAASPSLADLGHAFKNALTEEETRLLIEYMRDSVLAAFNDEEVTLPPDLAFKLEVLTQRLKKESNYYLDNLMKQLEADIRRSLKEKMAVPPPVPYTPPEVPLIKIPMVPPVAAPVAPGNAAPPIPGYVPTPWGYVPWYYLPQSGSGNAPAYTPPVPPRYTPPVGESSTTK